MLRLKKDALPFTVNAGVINIQVDKNTSQENLAKVAGMPEYAGLIESDKQSGVSKQTSQEKENKLTNQKAKEDDK